MMARVAASFGPGKEEGQRVETIVGIALIVVSAIEIIGIIRVVSANLNLGR
jgi:hypothetical protein